MFLRKLPKITLPIRFLASNKPNNKNKHQNLKLERKKTYLEGTHALQSVSFSPSLSLSLSQWISPSLGESLPLSFSSFLARTSKKKKKKKELGRRRRGKGKERRKGCVSEEMMSACFVSFFFFFFFFFYFIEEGKAVARLHMSDSLRHGSKVF